MALAEVKYLAVRPGRQHFLFAVGRPLKLRHQLLVLVGDANLILAQATIDCELVGLSVEGSAPGRFDEGDMSINSQGQLATAVGSDGKDKIGQGKNRTAVHRTRSVEMKRLNRHAGLGATGLCFEQFDTAMVGKVVVGGEEVEDLFHAQPQY